MGIELGADDYITKPFSLQLLLVKIKACFRRSVGEYVKKNNDHVNGLFLDESNYKIFYEDKVLCSNNISNIFCNYSYDE